MISMMIEHIRVKKDILAASEYSSLFTVEEMNKLVLRGMPLRDAYKKIAVEVEAGKFSSERKMHHTHEGSIGNLQTESIKSVMDKTMQRFNFTTVNQALQKLLQ